MQWSLHHFPQNLHIMFDITQFLCSSEFKDDRDGNNRTWGKKWTCIKCLVQMMNSLDYVKIKIRLPWNDCAAANAPVAGAGSFARLFRSTQSNHISHLQCKDFIVPTFWNTNTPPPHIPSSQHTTEQFADRGQAQFYCSTLIRWTECIDLKKFHAVSQWPLA